MNLQVSLVYFFQCWQMMKPVQESRHAEDRGNERNAVFLDNGLIRSLYSQVDIFNQ